LAIRNFLKALGCQWEFRVVGVRASESERRRCQWRYRYGECDSGTASAAVLKLPVFRHNVFFKEVPSDSE